MTIMLVEWVCTSLFLILTVLALRLASGRRVSARLRYALWAVVLVRLLVPVQLFTSPLAGTRVIVEQRTGQDIIAPPSAPTVPVHAGGNAVPDLGVQDGPSVVLSNFPRSPSVPSVPNPPEPPDFNSPPAWLVYLGWVWLGGSTLMAMVLAASNLRFARRLRQRRAPLEAADCPLPVYAAVGLPSPCLFGLVRPAIYVTPEAAADPNMLRHVIAHEYTHYRHGDHIWSLLRCAALAAHWWNPLVWVSAVLSRRDAELACDEGTLKRLGDGERLAYGNTLLALVTAKPSPGDLLSFATTMAGDKKSLKERVSRIACAPKRWLWAALAVVLVTALACACAFGQAEELEDEPEPDPTPAPTRNLDFEEQGIDFVMLNAETLSLAPDLNRNGVPETLIVGSLYLKEDANRIRNEGAEIDPVDMGVEVWEGDELLWTGIASYIHAGETSFLLYSEGGEDYLMEFDNHGGFGQAHADYRLFTLENGVETTVRENHVEYHYCTDSLASVKDHFDPEAVAAFVDEVNGLLAGCALLVDTGWNYRENSLLVDMTWLEGYAPGFQWADGQSTLENLVRFKMAAEHPLFARDMNRNMKVEMIRVTELDGGAGQQVELWEENRDGAETVWADEGYYAHAGANAVFLCTLDDKDYLLRYHPYMSQGICDYSYELFTLTRDGQEKVVKENHIEFQINFTPEVFPGPYNGSYDPEAIAAFMDEINGLLASSTQLINTDLDLLGTFQELGRLEDDLWWLDHWDPVFVRDRSKSLLENLKAYREAMEVPTVQGTDKWDERGEELILAYQGKEARFHGLWKHFPDDLTGGTVIDLDEDGRDEIVVILYAGGGTGAAWEDLYLFDADTLEQYDTAGLSKMILSQIEATGDAENFYLSAPGMARETISKSVAEESGGPVPVEDVLNLGTIIYYSIEDGKVHCRLGCDASGRTLNYIGTLDVVLEFSQPEGFQCVSAQYIPL